jgi:nicotinate phosphoribosyltransferase
MATSYLRRGMTGPATYSLFVRKLPPHRGFLVAAGLADALDFLEAFRFTPDELGYVAERLTLSPDDRERLRRLRFTGEVWAVPEGTVVTAGEPLLEVTAPIAEAQLVETALLNFVSFQTAVASKAARCRIAAPHAQLVDFGMRRAQSLQAARQVARSSYLAGFDATSNVEAAREFGLTPTGTMAHSYVQAFPGEREAFMAFAEDFPQHPTFL